MSRQMIGDRRIAFVAFTGSVAGGHAVQQAAGERFIASASSSAARIRPTCARTLRSRPRVENLVDGAYLQRRASRAARVERIYVHRDVYDEFVDGFVELTRKYMLGNPLEAETTLGPMVRTRGGRRSCALRSREAVAAGGAAR